jgi:hypothetical protein
MIVVTGETLLGHRVRDVKGQYFGAVVRSRGARLHVERLAGFATRPKGSVRPERAQSRRRPATLNVRFLDCLTGRPMAELGRRRRSDRTVNRHI